MQLLLIGGAFFGVTQGALMGCVAIIPSSVNGRRIFFSQLNLLLQRMAKFEDHNGHMHVSCYPAMRPHQVALRMAGLVVPLVILRELHYRSDRKVVLRPEVWRLSTAIPRWLPIDLVFL